MRIFKPLYLLMVLITGAAIAADSTVSRTISAVRSNSSGEVASSRSDNSGGARAKLRDASADNTSTNKSSASVTSRNATSARNTSNVSGRKAGDERGASTARRVGVTARSKVSETGRSVAVRGINSRSEGVADNRNIENRAAKSVTKESIAEAKGILEETAELNKSCQEQYNECMDQFCAVVDSNQKRCSCSSNLSKYSKVEEAVKNANTKLNEVAQNIRYIGLSADEIRAIMTATEAEQALAGAKDNTQNRNMLEQIENMIKDPKTSSVSYTDDSFGLDMSLDFSSDSTDIFNLDFLNVNTSNSFSNLRGSELYNAARSRCNTVLNRCKKAGATVNQITGNYDLSIDKDCIAYESGLKKMNETLVSNVGSAERMLQKARLAVLQNKNQYDAKGCIGALEACMTDDMVCGSDYKKCVDPTKRYIDENGDVVLGQNIASITKFMEGYDNTQINSDFLSSAYGTSINASCPTDGKCTVKYLLQKIGTKQKVTDEGLCRAVLDKCQSYTYKGDEYQPFNPVVVNYIQRAMVNIKASQHQIISEYASNCMVDVAACYNQQVTQVNSWTSSASTNSIYNIMNGACRSVALTCGLAIFVGDPEIENKTLIIDGNEYVAHGCPLPTDTSASDYNARRNSAIIQCLSEMFYQSLLCPDNSTYATGNTSNVVSGNDTEGGWVNTKCTCNPGYVVWSGACVPKCADGQSHTSTGRCESPSESGSDSGGQNTNTSLVGNIYRVSYLANAPSSASTSVTGTMGASVYSMDETKQLAKNTYVLPGYKFEEWNTEADGSGTSFADRATVKNLAVSPGEDVKLYAEWRPGDYQVSYQCGDGATYNKPAAQFLTAHMDQSYTTAPATTCTKTGYTFEKWMIQQDTSKLIGVGESFNYTYANGITLVAKWNEANVYNVNYNCGDGATGSVSPQTITVGGSIQVASNNCSKPGYSFAGWKVGNTSAIVQSGSSFTLTTANDITMTATWTANTYTISFNKNGATGEPNPASLSCRYGEACGPFASQGSMNKTNSNFGGWNTKTDGTGSSYSAGSSYTNLATSGTITLYAIWSVCAPCADSSVTHVNCTVNVLNNSCAYNTTCQTGYGNIQNNGTANASCSANSYTCSAGQYLPANSTSCASCPAGKYCVGGTYKYSDSVQGITGDCNANTYSTGGAGAATCTSCTTVIFDCNGTATNDPSTPEKCPDGIGRSHATGTTQAYVQTCHRTTSQTGSTEASACTGSELHSERVFVGQTCYVTGCVDGWHANPANAPIECAANQFNVSYNAGGGTGSAPSTPTKCAYGDTNCKAPNNTGYTRTGYDFAGWKCTSDNCSDKTNVYQPGVSIGNLGKNQNETIVLTAQWNVQEGITCSPGYYVPAGHTACDGECPKGSFCNGVGSWTYDANNDQGKELCAKGTYSNTTKASICTACSNVQCNSSSANGNGTLCPDNTTTRYHATRTQQSSYYLCSATTAGEGSTEYSACVSTGTQASGTSLQWGSCSILECEAGYFVTNGTSCTIKTYHVYFKCSDSGQSFGPESAQTAEYDYYLPAYTEYCTAPSGKIFAGWEIQGHVYADGEKYVSTDGNDKTAVAQWTDRPPEEYTVTFDCGTGSSGSPASETATVNTAITLHSSSVCSTPTNQMFTGWLINGVSYASGSSFSSASAGTISAVAQWTPAFTVTFNCGTGSVPTNDPVMETRTAKADGVAAVYLYSMVNNGDVHQQVCTIPSGKQFAGWKIGNTVYSGFVYRSSTPGPVTATAQWSAQTYRVQYNCGDGTGNVPSQETEVGQTTYLRSGDNCTPPPAPAGETYNYDFSHWVNSSGVSVGSSVTSNTPTTIYLTAQYKKSAVYSCVITVCQNTTCSSYDTLYMRDYDGYKICTDVACADPVYGLTPKAGKTWAVGNTACVTAVEGDIIPYMASTTCYECSNGEITWELKNSNQVMFPY